MTTKSERLTVLSMRHGCTTTSNYDDDPRHEFDGGESQIPKIYSGDASIRCCFVDLDRTPTPQLRGRMKRRAPPIR